MGGFEAEDQPLPPPDGRFWMITKGKRTKRPRTPSTAASSSSVSGGGGKGGDYDFSPSSSSGTTVLGSTEEEVDMAYCLILLAQGPGRRRDDQIDAKLESGELLRSNERLSEAAIGGGTATRTAFYVYECKTCSRTFPSFQALGGHRASHKKPRALEDAKKIPSQPKSDEDEEVGQLRRITVGLSPPSKLLQASKPKIHECSVRGAEFSSGQALGGHMRRHRAAAAPSAASGLVTMNIDPIITDNGIDEHSSQGAIVSLDLNLPAPEDDRKFQFAEVLARKPLLFSGRALVDCYH